MQISEVCIRVKERLVERMREERLTSDFLRRFLRCVCVFKRDYRENERKRLTSDFLCRFLRCVYV